MTEKSLNLKAGVLIIGSLYWQDYLGEDDNTIRKDWRENHLNQDEAIKVNTPIRYGRKSDSDIYTMTFANSCRKKNTGTGIFVPFKKNIDTWHELSTELKELSIAEGMKGKMVAGVKKPWCILGLRFNDNKINKVLKRNVINWYQSQLNKEVSFDNTTFKLGSERPCIGKNGILNIPWISPVDPKASKKLNEYDFLVATATLPTEYPKPNNLYENVISDTKRNYFRNNYKNGIITFQDKIIIEKFKKAKSQL